MVVRAIVVWLCAVCLVGCGSAMSRSPSMAMSSGAAMPPPAPMQPSFGDSDGAAQAAMTAATGPAANNGAPAAGADGAHDGATPPTAANVPPPMLIYTAEVTLQTDGPQVNATLERIIETATAMGGYLVRRSDEQVQVRIPSSRFREGLRRVEGLGEVLHRSVSADDISEEYRDLDIRLQNLRGVRRRLEEFLARAGTMADALAVERELERVTREIDTLEGRLRFLGARVAFSLVTVTVHPRTPIVNTVAPPASRRVLSLPVEWLDNLGLEHLLQVR